MDGDDAPTSTAEFEGAQVHTAPHHLDRSRAEHVERRYRQLVDHSPDAICVHDAGRLVYVNLAGVRWLAAESPTQLVGHLITEFVHPDSIPPMLAPIAELRHPGEASEPTEAVILRLDGSTLDVEAVSVLTNWDGRRAHQVIFRDLSSQKAAQAALRRAEHHFQTVVDSLDQGVVVISSERRIESANPAALRLLGVTMQELLGTDPTTMGPFRIVDPQGHRVELDRHPIVRTLHTRTPLSDYVLGLDRPDGQRVWLSGSYRLLDPDDPEHSAILTSFTDITAQHVASERLTYQATHDALTGLPNRTHVLTEVTHALQPGSTHTLAAVLFLDLDHLKSINDSWGHHVGDHVLRVVGQRLRRTVRFDDIVGRLGGDEFVALLLGPVDRRALDELTDRLHTTLSEPIALDGVTLGIGASIGIVVLDDDDQRDAAEILRHADTAMYTAKTTGRGKSHYFTDQQPPRA
jgi:diguanylate cyclase (GGDEF)-like protein/PAS domain S-box-containing protein